MLKCEWFVYGLNSWSLQHQIGWAGLQKFGISVRLDGDTVVVGAHGDDDDDNSYNGYDSGSVYVLFVRVRLGLNNRNLL